RRVAADTQPARESIRQALLREVTQLEALADHLGLVAPAGEILARRLDRLAIAVGTELHGEAPRRRQLGIAVAVGRAASVSALRPARVAGRDAVHAGIAPALRGRRPAVAVLGVLDLTRRVPAIVVGSLPVTTARRRVLVVVIVVLGEPRAARGVGLGH